MTSVMILIVPLPDRTVIKVIHWRSYGLPSGMWRLVVTVSSFRRNLPDVRVSQTPKLRRNLLPPLLWTTNFKKIFVSVMNMLLIYLFESMKLEKGHKKDYLALLLKLCHTVLFYEIGWSITRNGGLKKKLNTIHWKRICLVDLFCLEIIFKM